MAVWRARVVFLSGLYCKLGLAQVAFRIIRGLLQRWHMKRVLHDVPFARVPRHPIMGDLLDMVKNRKRLHHWREEVTRGLPVSKFLGPIWDTGSVALVVRDPVGVRHFLKDSFEKYTASEPSRDWFWKHIKDFLGNGIFVSKHGVGAPDGGKHWSHQRKIAATIFSRSNFNENMQKVFVSKAKRLQSVLKDGEKVDMQMQFFNFTMDSILKIFYGEESDTIGGERNNYGTAFDCAHRSFVDYSLYSLPFISVANLLPWPLGGHFGICAKLHAYFSPTHQQFIASLATLDQESERLITKCKTDPMMSERKDLLALFAQAVEKDDFRSGTSTKFLRDVVLNFVIAGRDTTACLLSWMFYILGTEPGIQQRVGEEVGRVLPGDTEPSLKLLNHTSMPLLHALVFETLRLHPPVPVDLKEAQCQDVLPNGMRVPQYTKMIFSPWAMGRDWPEPEAVRLERWIPFKQPAPHEFPVFQAGPRLCLGMDMAIFEAKLLAAVLLQEFSFALAPGEAERIHYGGMLTMSVCNSKEQDSHNLWLIPSRRRTGSRGLDK
eukprot:TRINITY_DN1712_c0_g5_i1.p1 TRINITY_DN1712_c0_g5~~TRINITY_DN1712_c0_g5_i1.p1  ORF type:complete len:566 (-),score=87.67 TRINITY_DN1712_c0_g5_i1:59-1702(-)